MGTTTDLSSAPRTFPGPCPGSRTRSKPRSVRPRWGVGADEVWPAHRSSGRRRGRRRSSESRSSVSWANSLATAPARSEAVACRHATLSPTERERRWHPWPFSALFVPVPIAAAARRDIVSSHNVSESLRACALIHMRALTRSARGSCLGTGRYTAPIRMAPTKVSPARATPDARIRSITLVAPDPEGAQTRSQRHWLPWHSTQCRNVLLIDQRESHCAIRLSHRIVNKPRAAPPDSSARSLKSADRERARTADGHGECRPRPTWCPRCRIGAATGSFEIKAGKCRHRCVDDDGSEKHHGHPNVSHALLG